MTKETGTNTVLNSEEWQSSERKRHIRTWIGGKLGKWSGRGLMGGLGSTLLALPALAQASSAELEAFQFVSSIPGVRSAKLLPNGDVQLKLADDRTVVVAAENAQVLENGSLMIADDAAAQIAQLSAVAEAGGAAATAGGISSTGLVLGGLGVAGAAAAAGGGGGGGEDASPDRTPERESRENGSKDPSPAPAPPPEPPLPTLNLAELQGGTLSNSTTEVLVPDGTATVEVEVGGVTKTATPDLNGNWTVSLTQAEAEALPQGASFVNVRNLDADGALISTGATEFTIDTVPPTIAISSISTGSSLNAAEQGGSLTVSGTTDAEAGQTVTVEINGQTYTGTVSGGNWDITVPSSDLSGLPDSSTVVVTADVSDRAGNPATQANNSFDTDFSAPL